MTQFALVMTHSSDQCPTSNATVRKLAERMASELPRLTQKTGVKFLAGPLVSTDHRSFAIVEAEGVQAVRDFIIESALIQWNSVELVAGRPMAETLKEIEKLKPIY